MSALDELLDAYDTGDPSNGPMGSKLARAELAAMRKRDELLRTRITELEGQIEHQAVRHAEQLAPYVAVIDKREKEIYLLVERVAKLEAALAKSDEMWQEPEDPFRRTAYRAAREATQ